MQPGLEDSGMKPDYRFVRGPFKGRPLSQVGLRYKIIEREGKKLAQFANGSTAEFYVEESPKPPGPELPKPAHEQERRRLIESEREQTRGKLIQEPSTDQRTAAPDVTSEKRSWVYELIEKIQKLMTPKWLSARFVGLVEMNRKHPLPEELRASGLHIRGLVAEQQVRVQYLAVSMRPVELLEYFRATGCDCRKLYSIHPDDCHEMGLEPGCVACEHVLVFP